MTGRPLYEIANEYRCIMDKVMEQEEISPELFEEIQAVEGDMKEKAVNVAAFIKNLEVEADGIGKALIAMEERSARIARKIDSLRSYLKQNLEACEMREVKCPMFDIRVRLNPESVAIRDETAIPGQYWREISTTRLDKALIARDLKSNILIPGAELVRNTRLEVK